MLLTLIELFYWNLIAANVVFNNAKIVELLWVYFACEFHIGWKLFLIGILVAEYFTPPAKTENLQRLREEDENVAQHHHHDFFFFD